MLKNYKFSIVFSFVGLWVTSLLPVDFELVFGFLLIFTFGMIHGSNDILILSKLPESQAISFFKILTLYLSIVILAIVIFYWIPILALCLFVIFSAYHFGEQHWSHAFTNLDKFWRHIFFFTYGLFVLFLIFSFNSQKVKTIVFEISNYHVDQLYSTQMLWGCGLVIGALLTYSISKEYLKTKTALTEIFSLIVLAIIFRSSTLIWGFTIYFILWHSIPSLREQIKFVYGALNKKTIQTYSKAAFPYWLISIVGMVLLYLVFHSEKHFYTLFFAFIAAVTFPHAVVMLKMFTHNRK
jgi:Brp/Blh family beta-carotene 15,15'-monooxygenase